VDVGWMGKGIAGLEADDGYAPNVAEHVGIRGDVRYVVNFNDNNNTVQFGSFHFWRASVGVVLR
jgi:hypothetical protein